MVILCANITFEIVHDRILDFDFAARILRLLNRSLQRLNGALDLARDVQLCTLVRHFGWVKFSLDDAILDLVY